jgi:L,D-peptidoglycan transpeptidase YkuD (ErfK/YbiS/YcfS/YnhG family)
VKKAPQVAAVLLTLAALIAVGLGRPEPAGAGTAPAYHPSRLAHVGDARQIVVVTGRSATSSYATLRTYQRGADGAWTATFPAMAARTGWHGWAVANKRVQGTGTSPQGTFRITTAFGLAKNPGTKLPYRHADGNDYWVGDQRDPRTYNLVQPWASAKRTWRISANAERLADYPTQYAHAAVIDFNRPAAASVSWSSRYSEWVTSKPVNVKLGSAIFLHVNGKGSTAGCVSLSRADLVKVLRWLDPAQQPRIVMAPESRIGSA